MCISAQIVIFNRLISRNTQYEVGKNKTESSEKALPACGNALGPWSKHFTTKRNYTCNE